MKNKTLVVDADTILFRAAMVMQENTIIVKHVSGRERQFKNRTDYKQWLSLNPKWLERQDEFEIQDVAHLTGNLGLAIHNVEARIKQMKECKHTSEVKMCLGGSAGNFRYEVGTILRYKGERKAKPLLLSDLSEAIAERNKDIVVKPKAPIETDDVVSLIGWKAHREGEGVILSYVDKDLHQIPGWRIDYEDYTKDPTYISEDEAFMFFCQQMLSGDLGTDNIPGIRHCPTRLRKEYGLKGAGGITKDSAPKFFTDCLTKAQMAQRVLDIYAQCYPTGTERVYIGGTISTAGMVDEMGRLLKLLDTYPQAYSFIEEAKSLGCTIPEVMLEESYA